MHSKVTDFGKEIHCVIALMLINFVDYSANFSTLPSVPFKITVSPEKTKQCRYKNNAEANHKRQ